MGCGFFTCVFHLGPISELDLSVNASVQVTWLINDLHGVKAAKVGLVLLLWCEKWGGVFARPRPLLLPPGKLSVFVGVAWRGDAEDPDAQVGGDLQTYARAVTCQVHGRQNLFHKKRKGRNKSYNNNWE